MVVRAEMTSHRHHSQDSNLGLSDSKRHELSPTPRCLSGQAFLSISTATILVWDLLISVEDSSSIPTGIQPHPVTKYCWPHDDAKKKKTKTKKTFNRSPLTKGCVRARTRTHAHARTHTPARKHSIIWQFKMKQRPLISS